MEEVETPDETQETTKEETQEEETTEEETNEESPEESKPKAKPKDADNPQIHVLNRKLDRIEKKLSGLSEDEEEEETEPVRQSDDETDFKIFHADRIKLCPEEFKAYRTKGYDLMDALRLAEDDKGIVNKDDSETTRQVAEGNDSNETNRSSEESVKVDDELIEMAGSKEKAIELKKKYGPVVKQSLSTMGKAEEIL